MNDEQVVLDLRSKVKPYEYVKGVSQSYFSNVLTRHEAGLLKPKTFVKFLNRFGYLKVDGMWLDSTINFVPKSQLNKAC